MSSSGSLMPGGGSGSLMPGGDTLPPVAHAASHQDAGSDEISVEGLSGTLADPQTALGHAISHQNGGGDEVSVAGLSGLLADAQTAAAHAASHQNGGGDEISVAGLSGVLADSQVANTLVETGGPTSLTMAAVPDISVLTRSGTDIVGIALASEGSILLRNAAGALQDSVGAHAVGVAQTPGIVLENTTAAALGAQQYSRILVLGGRGWKTNDSSSQIVRWGFQTRPIQGAANPTGVLDVMYSIAGGAWSTPVQITATPGIITSVVSASSRVEAGTAGSAQVSMRSLAAQGIGTTWGVDCTVAASPLHIIHGSRTDGAGNIVIASVYDRNAASITNAATMRLHSFGWTNSSDAYTELAAVMADGAWRYNGGANGQYSALASVTELTTITNAAFTDTTIQIPADAICYAVSTRVTVQPPGTAVMDVGVAGATTRFGTGLPTDVNEINTGTDDGMRYYSAVAAVRITPNGTPSDTTGRIRVTIHYFTVVPPTS